MGVRVVKANGSEDEVVRTILPRRKWGAAVWWILKCWVVVGRGENLLRCGQFVSSDDEATIFYCRFVVGRNELSAIELSCAGIAPPHHGISSFGNG